MKIKIIGLKSYTLEELDGLLDPDWRDGIIESLEGKDNITLDNATIQVNDEFFYIKNNDIDVLLSRACFDEIRFIV